jgi:hypothetical protein
MHGTLKRAQNPSRVVTKPNLKKKKNFSRTEIIYFFIHFPARDAQFKSIFETPIVVTGKKNQNHDIKIILQVTARFRANTANIMFIQSCRLV